jgi:hypothetical protein
MGWAKGHSGNPAGRAKGSGEIGRLRAQIGSHLPELLDRMLLQAMAGDTTAQRLLLERVFPTLKAEAMPLKVELPEGKTFTDTAKALLQAATGGEIAPDVAGELLTALARVTQIEAADELRKKLEELESLA